MSEFPGHFGHIELARPVFYPGAPPACVKKILECMCVNCEKLKASIVSRVSLSSTRFVPHRPSFLGLSRHRGESLARSFFLRIPECSRGIGVRCNAECSRRDAGP
ncbi:hypothetical protein B0H11DRAFT_1748620 [Mycena galericulata]|nr:hypothetical protein B0H11DRAFT_1748620 [Mycena galericulata]